MTSGSRAGTARTPRYGRPAPENANPAARADDALPGLVQMVAGVGFDTDSSSSGIDDWADVPVT
jgi:hypothetical protein